MDVFSRTSVKSEVVKKLNKGDLLTIEFETEIAEGEWRGVVEVGETTISETQSLSHWNFLFMNLTLYQTIFHPVVETFEYHFIVQPSTRN